MSNVVNVTDVNFMRMLRSERAPNLVILRAETQSGQAFNFFIDRATFSHAVDVWRFDLDAIEGALQSGAPGPGKPFGSADKKAS